MLLVYIIAALAVVLLLLYAWIKSFKPALLKRIDSVDDLKSTGLLGYMFKEERDLIRVLESVFIQKRKSVKNAVLAVANYRRRVNKYEIRRVGGDYLITVSQNAENQSIRKQLAIDDRKNVIIDHITFDLIKYQDRIKLYKMF
ncbi:hypothetical protein GQ42DRAFT_163648, partial [Ramicandelaber brevisporus]